MIKRNRIGEFKNHTFLDRVKKSISNFIIKQWDEYLRKFLITVCLISYGITGTVIYILLADHSVSVIQIADASEVSADADVAQAVSVAGVSNGVVAPSGDPIRDLITRYFGSESETAIKVAKAESGLRADNESWCDRMADGRPFSIGLMQINLTQHKLGEIDCTKAFKGINYHAVVIDEGLYQKCVKLAKNPEINLKEAKSIFERGGWSKWGAFNQSMLN